MHEFRLNIHGHVTHLLGDFFGVTHPIETLKLKNRVGKLMATIYLDHTANFCRACEATSATSSSLS